MLGNSMGCDIHMYIEYKVGDGPWFADKNHKLVTEYSDNYDTVCSVNFTARNYDLFGKLAGVRTSGPVAIGLPTDVTDLVAKASELYGSDGHSHSFSSLEEFRQALKDCHYLPKDEPVEAIEPIAFYADTWAPNRGYVNILKYLEKEQLYLKLDIESEKMLLGQDINTDVQVRLVYFFDN